MSRSGSNNRKLNRILAARFSDHEVQAIRRMAERHGQSVATLLRTTLLNIPAPARSVRRPTVEVQAVARLLGELGKIGSNINQIAKEVNIGRRLREDSLEMALRDLGELRLACLQALGKEPRRGPKDEDDEDED